MCIGGRILDHLDHGLDDPKNDIFFVGYQAKGTLGRRIIEKRMPVKAGVYSLFGYSAHADQKGFVDWVKSIPEHPNKIRLAHGERGAKKVLAEVLSGECRSVIVS
jgi:metallo-beta-lactamase family protein